MAIVSVKKVESYDQRAVDAAITAHFEALNIEADLRPGMKVLLKPNLLTGRRPEQCVTTHPAVVRAVAAWLRARGVEHITLADSPGGPYRQPLLSGIYRACGLAELPPLVTLNLDVDYREVPAAPGSTHQNFNIINPVLEADYIINLAKMKTHGMTVVSLGIKNLFGSIPGLQKPKLHYQNPSPEGFANMLLSLAETVKPHLTVIDAVDGMEGNGPSGGSVRHAGVILASKDLFAQDYYATTLMGIDPGRVQMLKAAVARGLIDPSAIQVTGDDVKPFEPPFRLPDTARLDFASHLPKFIGKPIAAIMDRVVKPVPVVAMDKCVGCGKCKESCPQQIIKIENNKAVIAKRNCISCFCCQEMCPAKAIEVEKRIRML